MANQTPDYYKTLGVSKDASQAEIKKAFRKLAQKHHPDAGGDEAKFKEINEAYEVLGDKEKRQVYDQFGSMGGAAGFAGGNPYAGGQNPFGGGTRVQFNGINLEDLFGGASGWGDILERMRGGQGAFGTNWDFKANGGSGFAGNPFGGSPRPVSLDVNATLQISLEEAVEGSKKQFRIQVPGRQDAETLTVKIPKGSIDGTKLKIKGHGKPGQNGQPDGNLIVELKIAPHPYFKLDGADVIVDVPITFCEAALGLKVEIPTPTGKRIRIKIPAGAQSGKRLTIKDQGIKSRKQTGKLIAVLNVQVPSKLDDKQKKKLEKYNEVESKEVRPWH